MTAEALVLTLLSGLALAGVMWTAWDIRTDLRRRRSAANSTPRPQRRRGGPVNRSKPSARH